MNNLEQIRAAAALEPSRTLNKAAVNKLPAMIITNGLLATIAFCHSESSGENRSEMAKALLAMAAHLQNQGLIHPTGDLLALVKDLSGRDSAELRRITQEALAFIGYLRRFARKTK